MPSLLHLYANAYVSAAVIDAFQRAGLFFSAAESTNAEVYLILAADVGLFANKQPQHTWQSLPLDRIISSHFIH